MTKKEVHFDFDLPLAKAVSHEKAFQGVRYATLEAENLTKYILSSQYSNPAGREYPRGKTAVHRASAPGQAPATDSGRLRNSVSHEIFADPLVISGEVYANTEYAAALEFGSENGTIAPRPFMSRLFTEFGDRLFRVFAIGARS